MTDEYNAGQMVLFALIPYPVNFGGTSMPRSDEHAASLFHDLRNGTPAVELITVDDDEPFDVNNMRWIFKGGVSPLMLCASDPTELAELTELAGTAATVFKMPVFLVSERSIDNCKPVKIDFVEPQLQFEVAPLDGSGMSEEEFELARLYARHARPPRGIDAVRVDAPRDDGRAEWLVISYGATVGAAKKAAAMARKAGQRVDVLHVRVLWPLPEEEIIKAAMGTKHVVVAERNFGQYANEIRRILPGVPVIHAGTALSSVTPEMIFEKLQRTPRCC